jgi:hypothetical protein
LSTIGDTVTAEPQTGPVSDPTAGERLSWMGKNSTKLIIALVVLVIAAAVVVFSFSLFSTSSANPGNMTTSGIMQQNNSADGQAILTVQKLLPGKSGAGTVTITNVGDAAGHFTLTASNLVDTPATPPFSQVLNLVVSDGTAEVYNGRLGAIATVDLGTWAAEAKHTYTFTVTFDSTAGNQYQNAKTTLDFTWDATQSTS